MSFIRRSAMRRMRCCVRLCSILTRPKGRHSKRRRACALDVHETLQSLGIPCYAKTSGATGLQVYVPTKSMPFEQGRRLNAFFGQYFAAKHPDTVTIERSVKSRGGKLYFDYLQMARGKSIISVYSPRAVPCGAVSMPVTWDELERGISPCDFTLKNGGGTA